jgi:hypothetical protein
MPQAIQLKFLVAITGILLSILGIVGYEHHQAEIERQRVEAERKAQQEARKKFIQDLLKQEQDPRNHMRTDWSKFLREH